MWDHVTIQVSFSQTFHNCDNYCFFPIISTNFFLFIIIFFKLEVVFKTPNP